MLKAKSKVAGAKWGAEGVSLNEVAVGRAAEILRGDLDRLAKVHAHRFSPRPRQQVHKPARAAADVEGQLACEFLWPPSGGRQKVDAESRRDSVSNCVRRQRFHSKLKLAA